MIYMNPKPLVVDDTHTLHCLNLLLKALLSLTAARCVNVRQVSTTVETFQDLSLPIPGKEDLAKLHSSIHQNLPVKTGLSPDTYGSQGWIPFIMDSIRRSVQRVQPSRGKGRRRRV